MTQDPVSRRRFLEQMSVAVALALPAWARAADSLPPKKLGVALVGLGNYSTHQLGPALRETQFCALTGVVTGSREKGEQWARDYGFSPSSRRSTGPPPADVAKKWWSDRRSELGIRIKVAIGIGIEISRRY